jgi:hypothetical protein
MVCKLSGLFLYNRWSLHLQQELKMNYTGGLQPLAARLSVDRNKLFNLMPQLNDEQKNIVNDVYGDLTAIYTSILNIQNEACNRCREEYGS